MPYAPKRPCWRKGCGEYQPCPKHAKHQRPRAQVYDDRRGSAHSRGYDASHRAWRERILARDPLCKGCDIEPSTVADHIKPVVDGGQWTEENGQGLCRRCHAKKTAKERDARRTRGQVH